MTHVNENGTVMDVQKKIQQWAKKKLIVLDDAEEYRRDLSELTGSRYHGDFNKISKLDNYKQAQLIEMMFQETEIRNDINELLGVEEYYGLLFAGPSGCGKMTTAKHLVGNLRERGYARLVVLTGIQLGNCSLKKALKRMKAVLKFATEEQPMILIIEQLSENRYAEELYDVILEAEENQEPGVIFPILIEREADGFSSALKRIFPLFMFELPSLEERKNYVRLHQNVEMSFDREDDSEADGEEDVFSYKIVFDGITPDDIAAETEGFSYAQLKYLMEYMKLYMADMIVRDNTFDEYTCERIKDEGYYKVKGHMVRQGIRMLSHPKGAFLHELRQGLPTFRQNTSRQPQQSRYDSSDMGGQDAKLSLSEIEKKVKMAADGGPKDYKILVERYRNPVYEKEEFGKVDERLANASDEDDEILQ